MLKAFVEEFTDKDNIELLIKLNPAYGVPNMAQIMQDLSPRKTAIPMITINHGLMDRKDLVNIYNDAHCFVSPTRAESFNLPGIEAKACGLMTIQTNYGGQIDYMKEGTDMFILSELSEQEHDLQYEGCRWATVDIADLRKKLRWCYEHQDEVKQRGEKAKLEAKDWTWDHTAKLILKEIKKSI